MFNYHYFASLKSLFTLEFLNFRTLKNCDQLKIQIKKSNYRVMCAKDANGMANSEDPDQTDPLGAV